MGSDMEKRNEATIEVLEMGNIIVDILRSQITGGVYSLPVGVDFGKLYKLCEIHKVTAMVAPAVSDSEAPADIKALFKKQLFRCAARHTAQEQEMNALIDVFSENGIKHCFLKGTKVSRYYDIPDMRFMLDMDVYIEPDKIDEAQKIMKDRGYEIYIAEDDKDIGFTKKPFLNIELHKELKYDYDKGYEYYKGAFSRLKPAGETLAMDMEREDFYVYILSHMAHHFETAGTGIRSIVDHYYLRKKLLPECDVDKLADGLAQTGLAAFAQRMDKLCDYWFCGGECDDGIREIADYIILSGVYGTQANEYLSGIARGDYTDKRSSYFIARLFPGVKSMAIRYPILKKLPFLLPLFWIVRLISALFDRERLSGEVKNVNSATADDKSNFIAFLERNGL